MGGSTIVKHLRSNVIESQVRQSMKIITRTGTCTHAELNLTNQTAKQVFLKQQIYTRVNLS
jgi:hypothetical protein